MSIYAEAGRVPPEQIENARLRAQVAEITKERDALKEELAANKKLPTWVSTGSLISEAVEQARQETAKEIIDMLVNPECPFQSLRMVIDDIKTKYHLEDV